ncbi:MULTISPECIES: DUF732 domain-containing protein [unclassified Mycobacterium]|uniref:DUF732 domain-containing protein n=1 Tax=unclassified Mycobacterium TaxID=2642494 RepID=UPI0029C73DD0|nr:MULTISPECIES: DUF732 domain-containing protein [unclassified Mycobacterium]
MKQVRVALALAVALNLSAFVAAPAASADAAAYLLNVTVRPGYDFANADAALAYGHDVCDTIRRGESYAPIVSEIMADFNTFDEYQAEYLIAQSAQELGPELIWQLRRSAGGYRPTPA